MSLCVSHIYIVCVLDPIPFLSVWFDPKLCPHPGQGFLVFFTDRATKEDPYYTPICMGVSLLWQLPLDYAQAAPPAALSNMLTILVYVAKTTSRNKT